MTTDRWSSFLVSFSLLVFVFVLSTYILGVKQEGSQGAAEQNKLRQSWSPEGPGFREISQELESFACGHTIDMVMIVNLYPLAYLHIWVCKEFEK